MNPARPFSNSVARRVVSPLDKTAVASICHQALARYQFLGRRVLVLIPDQTRHGPIDLFFEVISELLTPLVASLDVLVATGTHAPMSDPEIRRHLRLERSDSQTAIAKTRFFNHVYSDRGSLALIGELAGSEMSELTGGVLSAPVQVRLNRLVLEYDHLLLVSPVVPHEALGFSGGNKYFFPGVAGAEAMETFHWLAALITNPLINGIKDTPTRRVIDRMASLIPVPRTCFAFVVNERNQVVHLSAGDPLTAWSLAADFSSETQIRYLDQPHRCVLAVLPTIYRDLWVGGKAMYKLEPIVADGGELIIYAPDLHEISPVHGSAIRRLGYHVRDYFLADWPRFREESKLLLAHSTNVRGVGTFHNGVEHARIEVTLATGISEDTCRAVNLNYRDPRSIDPTAWGAGRGPASFVVTRAGQDLYRLRDASIGPTHRSSP